MRIVPLVTDSWNNYSITYKLILALALVLYSANVFAYDFKSDGIYYNLNHDEKTAEVTCVCHDKDKDKEEYKYVGIIVIPDNISYNGIPYSVTSIDDEAFHDCSGLTSITIPNSVTNIGMVAFVGCSGLTSITIPNSVTSIGYHAFRDCIGLTSITIPNSVTNISNRVFYGCIGLTSITVSSGNTKYDSRNNCNAIIETSSNTLITGCKNTNIPNSVTSIGEDAFSGCSGLTSITIPNSVTSIGNDAFAECSGLTSIMIPNSVTSIGNYAFAGCSSLTSITIPNSVTSIGHLAFRYCTGLTSITIPNSVTSIGMEAFFKCSGLTSITIPNSVTSIGWGAFKNCTSLTSVISEIQNPFQIDESVFREISSNATLQVPEGTKSKYEAFSGWTTNFKEIVEAEGSRNYDLTISSSGNGSVSYNGASIRDCSQTFNVEEGTNATVTITPDNGYFIASVKVNDTNVTTSVSYNKYTIESIADNTTLTIRFEEIPSTTYSLNVSASGNGSVMYNDITIRNESRSYTVNEGDYATFVFTPDTGYRIASVLVNNFDVTYLVSNDQYSISDITTNTTVDVTFEAIPVTTYSLSITASGNGSASFNGTMVKNRTQSFSLNEGSDATITFNPDNGNSIASVKVNNTDVTSQVTGNRYTFSNITANTTLEVAFQEDVNALTVDGLNYTVTSQSDKTITFTGGDFGLVLTVPATITANGKTWRVTGIDQNALKNNTELAAIIWNPEAAFTATVSNPNLLLYVKSAQYGPSTINNVVVNGKANSITLVDDASGNNFYCPQAFTAQSISYTHHYSMMTGIGESRGWETIALPFDVQKVTHSSKGTIVPFAKWSSGVAAKPFWLYELKSNGFVEASVIKANTPYIISMPNNLQYADQYQLVGNVTFSAENATVKVSDNLQEPKYNDRTFVPSFQVQPSNLGYYALNVTNDYFTNNSGMTDGSRFVLNMRKILPFEAYMTSSSSNAPESIGIFDDMTTEIKVIPNDMLNTNYSVYDLQGRKIEKTRLTKGIYIVNGQKVIIR